MDENLTIVDLYNNCENKRISTFENRINSTLHVYSNYEKVECDYEWLDKIDDTIRYIDNILRNPNRFIINEEDIVKIELARRVTVESIKHLSRNTNLIQDIDKKTGDVKPSKILNINKEESYDTYENRFIYSLIQNMRMYIDRKKRNIITANSIKDRKTLEYQGSSNVGREQISVKINLDTKLSEENKNKNDNGDDILQRIEKVEQRIGDLTTNQVYQNIKKLHIALVTSPIKKTNLILKNVNFQYALNLWNYLQANMDDDVKKTTDKKDFYDNGNLKKYMDESFMLDYLVANSINATNSESNEETRKQIQEKIVASMVSKLIDLGGGNIDEDELKELVGETVAVVRYKTVINDREIHKIFKEKMDDYLSSVSKLKI